MSSQIRIFVSSPSDVPAERIAVERVATRAAAQFEGFEIRVTRWESGRYYSAHTGFQEQIEEIGGFDLVVGILWSRLGTPLPPGFGPRMPPPREGQSYPSGTAFEILEAIRLRKERDAPPPEILVYRKLAPTPSAKADDDAAQEDLLAQRRAVNAFFRDFFANETEGFKGAFQTFEDLDGFEARFEADLIAWLRDTGRLDRQRRWRVEDPERGCPFVGLNTFGPKHRDVFFGRRADTERARERLDSGNGFLLIDGASGTGKSSLVRAGLLPRLEDLDPDLRIAVTMPDTADPLTALAHALLDDGALPELAQGDYPDPAALARHLAGGGDAGPVLRALDRAAAALTEAERRDSPADLRIVLLVDQFEALFTTRVPPEIRSAYAGLLAGLVASGRVRVIATMRANAREAALELPMLGRLINGQMGLSLEPPGPDAMAEIIRGPAEAAALDFERDAGGVSLDEVLLREVEKDPAALPLLQFALEKLYEAAAKRVTDAGAKLGDVPEDAPVLTLTHADYRALGGLAGAIGHQAEAALKDRSEAVQSRLAPLVRALTEAGSGAFVLARAPLAQAAPDLETQELAEALISARILVQGSERDGDTGHTVTTLRFSHERVLTAWDQARDAAQAAAGYLRVRADLVRAEARWREAGYAAGLLLPSGILLIEAEKALRDFGPELDRLNPSLSVYVRASGQRARLSQRLTLAAALAFAAVAAVAGWFGYDSQRQSARVTIALEDVTSERNRAEQALRGVNAAASGLAQELAAGTKNWPGVDKSFINRMLIRAQNILLVSLAAGDDDVSPTQRSLAIVYSGMADIQVSMGNYRLANELARDALRMFQTLHQKGYEPTQIPTDIQIVLRKIAETEEQLGNVDAAETVLRDGLAMIAPSDPASASLVERHQAALTRLTLGRVLSGRAETRDDGIAVLQAAADELAQIVGDSNGRAFEMGATNVIALDLAKRQAIAAYYLGKAFLEKDDDQLAINALQEADRHLNTYAGMRRDGLDEVDMRRLQADAEILLAMALLRRDKLQDALQKAANAVVSVRNLITADGRRPEHVEQIVLAYAVLAGAFGELDELPAARNAMRQAIHERKSLADAAPNDALLHQRLAELQLVGAEMEESPAPLAQAAIATVARFTSHPEIGARAQELIDKARALIAAVNGEPKRR